MTQQAATDVRPLAYFLTWSCYGTWLHGDRRGSVDRWTAHPGTQPLARNAGREASDRARLRAPPFYLGAPRRSVVSEAVVDACRYRGWILYALNVRTTHVHVVVGSDLSAAVTLAVLKARATRRLREEGRAQPEQPTWTKHGSTRYLWTETDVAGASRYVLFGQGGLLPTANAGE